MSDSSKKPSDEAAPSYLMGWRVLTCQQRQDWLSLQIEPMKTAPCRVYVPTEGSWRTLAPSWARDSRALILSRARQVAWNRDLDWIESDRATFWPRHVNDPPNGSLESTQGGRWLDGLRMFHPDAPKKFSREECKQLWCAAAEKMALAASGRVTIDADEVIPGSVFQEVELPALKRNPGVTLHFVAGAVRRQPEAPREGTRRPWVGGVLMAAGASLWGLGILAGFAGARGTIPDIPFLRRSLVLLGGGLVSLGAALIKGNPIPIPEKRPTSVVIVALSLVLFGVTLLGAGLAMADNFRDGAGGLRWAITSGLTLASVLVICALFRDLFSRFGARLPSDGSAGTSTMSS